MATVRFHLAFPVRDIAQTKAYYADGLGCGVGRENAKSIILELYGHQLVAHVTEQELEPQKSIYPRHFGLVFSEEGEWEALCDRVQQKQLSFYVEPKRRFEGSVLEHRTFFLEDPFHNLMEFKFYSHDEAIFGAIDQGAIGDA